MNILESILQKVFPHSAASSPQTGQTETQAAPCSPSLTGAPMHASRTQGSAIDVSEVISALAAKHGGGLKWQTSIVDLLKALDLDSSITARKQLAQELGYSGDTNDSAKMNIWLQGQVIQKFTDNGGKTPESMKH